MWHATFRRLFPCHGPLARRPKRSISELRLSPYTDVRAGAHQALQEDFVRLDPSSLRRIQRSNFSETGCFPTLVSTPMLFSARSRVALLLFPLLLIAGSSTVQAQRTSGAVGLGGQIGEPSGITLKIHNEDAASYDFLVAWDLDDFFFLNAHALFSNDIPAENLEQELEWFIGPGAFLGILDQPAPEDDDGQIGISGRIGLNFVIERQFEIYGQVTPRISLIPDTDGDIGGGVGFRYYF